MSFIDSISDRMYYENRKDYTQRQGNIVYLDSKPLTRPLKMPAAQRVIAVVVLIAALFIGGVLFSNTALKAMKETADQKEAITANIARPGGIETLPDMKQLAALDANAIMSNFQEAGYVIYDATQPNDEGDIAIYKIPGDMTFDEAAALYVKGISGLNPAQATKILNGSWFFETDNANSSKVVRYADFTTTDPQKAIQTAIAHEGFDAQNASESGVDDSGNTYMMGTVDVNGGTYSWKVSSLPLSDIYSITGVPDACYVGVRMTRA